jgi:hypothetical protein
MAFPRNIGTPTQVISGTFESVATKSLPLIIIGKAPALPGEVRRPFRESRVWIVMRNLNSERASRNVYISSDLRHSMHPRWHNMW